MTDLTWNDAPTLDLSRELAQAKIDLRLEETLRPPPRWWVRPALRVVARLRRLVCRLEAALIRAERR